MGLFFIGLINLSACLATLASDFFCEINSYGRILVRGFDLEKNNEPPHPGPLLLWGGEGEKRGRRMDAPIPIQPERIYESFIIAVPRVNRIS
jgi:hypothetical protein